MFPFLEVNRIIIQQQTNFLMLFIQSHKPKILWILRGLFLVFGILYILQSFVHAGFLGFFKALPLVMLILMMLLAEWKDISNKWRVIVGIFFGGVGDVVLDERKDMFPIGAGFFLLGHILYNISIISLWKQVNVGLLVKRKYVLLFSTVFFLSVSLINLSTIISDKLKEENLMLIYLLPVYLVFLSLNCINSLVILLGQKKVHKYEVLLFMGTVFFYISDNLLGRTMFADLSIGEDKKYNSLFIMLSYYAGQYCIAHGVMKKSLMQAEKDDELSHSMISTE